MIEKDETLSTCQIFNAEVCYGNGLQYNTEACTKQVKDDIQDFLLCNNRCGDFYESYMEDAEVCAQVLGITLTKRSSDKVSMAGFPYHALDTYLPRLIRSGKRVAICDQVEDTKAKTLVKRGITDLVSGAEQPSESAAPKRCGRKPKGER